MEKLLYGAAYYDEYMPYDRIERDMEMMKRAGMNVIRIAESTWSTWEKKEGEFDFTSLHRMLDAAKRHGIYVIVGTPTYAIPSWLADKADDILALTHGGQSIYGHRQNMDITSPIYLKYAERIIRKLLEEVSGESHVIGFQIDNETKAYDTCGPRAQKMFVDWLKEKYENIEQFNQEFGLDYWSNRVDEWEHFPDIRGTINGSLAAEYCAFQRKLVTDFFEWQEKIIREYLREDQFITHNFDYDWDPQRGGLGLQPEVNQFEAAKHVSIAGCDIYHPSAQDLTGAEITVLGNISRGLKQDNYLILETEAQGNMGWLPYPGQLRLCAYSHVANGANMVEYWHWHSIHNAIESYWKGVLSHDLEENETYRECMIVGNEWKRIGTHLVNLKKNNKVAVVVDNASCTGLIQFPLQTDDAHGYNRVLRWLCDTLYRMNIEYDVICADEKQLNKYQVIILPAMYSAKESFLVALDDFVKAGGNLIATFKTAFADEHIKIRSEVQPYILHEALGIRYDQFTYPNDVRVIYDNEEGIAKEWMELVSTTGAEVIAKYEHPVWNRYAAVTRNSYGKGRAMYLATMFEENVLAKILFDFFNEISFESKNIKINADYPVSVKQGTNDLGKQIVYLLNYSTKEQTVTLPMLKGVELITDTAVSEGQNINIKPWDVAVIEY